MLARATALADHVQRIRSEMIDAVVTRNAVRVRELLAQDDTLVHAKSDGGQTAVLLAAYHRATEIREILLSRSPTLDLFEACAVGNTQRVREVLDEHPEQVNEHSPDGYTPLGLAAFFGHYDTVALLLESHADVSALSRDGQFDNTALHAAVAGHYVAVAQRLIEHGADVNAQARGTVRAGFTPLHVAASRGFADLVTVLTHHGADVHVMTEDGQTASAMAAANGYADVAAYLRERYETDQTDHPAILHLKLGGGFQMGTVEAWFGAVKANDADKVSVLLASQADLQTAREQGTSAILLAAYHGADAVVQVLLAAGVSLNLFEAATVGKLEAVLDVLEQHPGLVLEFSHDGFTALGLAAFFGHPDIVEVLLARGADVNAVARNPMKVMPLHAAVAHQHTVIADMLLQHGADVNARQQEGFTALLEAVQNRQLDMVELLVRHGADVNLGKDDGVSPLAMAMASASLDIVNLLEAHGAGAA